MVMQGVVIFGIGEGEVYWRWSELVEWNFGGLLHGGEHMVFAEEHILGEVCGEGGDRIHLEGLLRWWGAGGVEDERDSDGDE